MTDDMVIDLTRRPRDGKQASVQARVTAGGYRYWTFVVRRQGVRVSGHRRSWRAAMDAVAIHLIDEQAKIQRQEIRG